MDFRIAAAHLLAANAVALVAVLASGVGGRSMAHDVFISHTRTDKEVAEQVIAALAAEHISCWTAPQDALATLDKAIPEARVLILLLSAASSSSPQVERELALAAALGLPVLVLRVDDVLPSPGLSPYVTGQPSVDASRPPFGRHLSQLCQLAAFLLQRSADASPRAVGTGRLILPAPRPVACPAPPAGRSGKPARETSQGRQLRWLRQSEDAPPVQPLGDDADPVRYPGMPLEPSLSRVDESSEGPDGATGRSGPDDVDFLVHCAVPELVSSVPAAVTAEPDPAPAAAVPEPPAAAPEPSSGPALRETGLIVNAEMRRRIEETRARLRAKALDAMMSGEAALRGRDDQPVAPPAQDIKLGGEVESTLDEAALWDRDVQLPSHGAASAGDLPESRSMPGSVRADRARGGLADECSEATPSSWRGQSSRPSEDAPPAQPFDGEGHPKFSRCCVPSVDERQRQRDAGEVLAKPSAARVTDSVDFTLAWPAAVIPGSTFVLDVWAHLGEERAEVLERIDEEFVGVNAGKKTRSGARIARGRELVVRLDIDGLFVEEPEDVLLWDGHMTSVDFIVSVPGDVLPGSRAGRVSVSVNGLRVSRIAFELEVVATTAQQAPLHDGFSRHDRAFASYASEDRDRVLARVQGMETVLPLKVFVDVDTLRSSGGGWREQLRSKIDRAQVMYLFWSRAAQTSEWVNWEWRYALERHGLEFIDPVPLEPPAVVPPPPELQTLHFDSKWLAFMRDPALS